ncbi:techylectin-5B-like isoform X1 [Macrobrachium rosenbergii]|uniref:techylectin-5B-like isoform X1 n=1 Tax=Macrobrachium rosenbergii TaxID=79674 RepID=UPI0034D4E2B1
METVRSYAIFFLLHLLSNMAVTSSGPPTTEPLTQGLDLALTDTQNIYYTLPLEVVERLLSKESATANSLERLLALVTNLQDRTSRCTSSCKEPPNSDTFTKLLILLLEKIDKEQDRLEKEVASLTEALKNEKADPSQGSFECPREPTSASCTAVLSFLQGLQDISGPKDHSGCSDPPAQLLDSFANNCHRSPDRPKDCYELYQQGKNESGIYTIYPHKCHRAEKGIQVWCDLEGDEGGWTVALSRKPCDEQVSFNRGWRDYKIGFGDPQTEYWIGNDALHSMTYGARQILRIELEDWDGAKRFVEYSSFSVESEDLSYRLHLGGVSGTGGDAFSYHDNMAFTTSDRDNDRYGGNCAVQFAGGFWYNTCHEVSPTSLLLEKQTSQKGITWTSWYPDRTTLKEVYFKLKEYPCL